MTAGSGTYRSTNHKVVFVLRCVNVDVLFVDVNKVKPPGTCVPHGRLSKVSVAVKNQLYTWIASHLVYKSEGIQLTVPPACQAK